MNFVLIGAPLSGKGTISKMLSKYFQIPHISMGDLLRNESNNNSEFSSSIINSMKEGKLINDDLVKRILQNRLSKKDCAKGYVLDGFPRNIKQALMLETFAKIDKVIYVISSPETVINRLSNRYVCPKCWTSYNTKNYEKNYCEKCNEKLVKRVDDTEQALSNRLADFRQTSSPILDKYVKESKLVTIENEGDINLVFEKLLGKL